MLLGGALVLPFATFGCAASPSPVGINRLRPPGAVAESDFSALCIRCGRCSEVCPFFSVKLLDASYGSQAGTPLILADDVPCYLCMQCVDVCPSSALRSVEMEQTRMGLAVIDRESCVAWTGEALCRTCYSVCPLRDRAIELIELKPEVIDDACTGCGICAQACPITNSEGKRPVVIDPERRS